MTMISTHTLNAVDGSHARNVALALYRLNNQGIRKAIFRGQTDCGGRFEQEVNLGLEDTKCNFEMVFYSGAYFETQMLPTKGTQILSEIVIRFTMPNASQKYHIPIIMAPHSYSVWWPSQNEESN